MTTPQDSVVYILQEQANMDFSPAEMYGDVQFMGIEISRMKTPSPRDQGRLAIMAATAEKFRPDLDYIVFTGSPVVIATMAAIMGRLHSRFRTLRWDRVNNKYIPVTIDLGRITR